MDLEALWTLLHQAGFDIFQPFPTSSYNRSRPTACSELPSFGRRAAVSVLVGNTHQLWPAFLSHVTTSGIPANPLDEYTEHAVSNALIRCAMPASQVFFVHTPPGKPGFVGAAHAAQVSGLAYSSKDVHLSIHPTYGPWFAMRAIICLDADLDLALPRELHDPIPKTELPNLMVMIASLMDKASYGDDWRAWLKVRDAIGVAVGAQDHRYPDDMIAYHYTGDISCLIKQGKAV